MTGLFFRAHGSFPELCHNAEHTQGSLQAHTQEEWGEEEKEERWMQIHRAAV